MITPVNTFVLLLNCANIHSENVAVWRESTHEDTIRSVNSDITRYGT